MLIPDVVARSFIEIADQSGFERATKGLISMLQSRGATSLLPRVLKSIERIIEQQMQRKTQVIVAKRHDTAEAQSEAKRLFGEQGVVTYDDTLIGGFVVRKGAALYDASFKKALVHVYRSIVK